MSNRETAPIELPFGRPFASQMSGDEVRDGFCNMPNMQFSIQSGSLAFTSRRGGGKTHMLRKLYYDRRSSGIKLCEYEPMCLSTEFSLPELQAIDDDRLPKHLKVVWETVLALRVARVIADGLRDSGLDRAARKAFMDGLEERLKEAGISLDQLSRTASIFNEVLPRLSHQYRARRWLLDKFNRREFIEHLKNVDVTAYLFLDDADDEYHDSPSFWNVNLTSFYHAISFLRRELPKIHIVTAMRREIYDHMQHEDPNWTRIAGPDNVKDIVWDIHSLRSLFEWKIQALPPEMVRFGTSDDPWVTRLLGLGEVTATQSPCPPEPIFEYICRHTFYRARDLIYMGNSLWHQLRGATRNEKPESLAEKLRAGVANAAGMIAREVTSESDAVLQDLAPNNELDRLPPTTYLLTRLRRNIVTREQLGEARAEVKEQVPALAALNPYDVLCYWGLLGWAGKDGKQKFNFETSANAPRTMVRPKSELYFIHPAVYDLPDILGGIDIVYNHTVGHGYDVPPKSCVRTGSNHAKFVAEPPYRLDWQMPRIVDVERNSIPVTPEQHVMLKSLFDITDLKVVPYGTLAKVLQRHRYGAVDESQCMRKDIEQVLRRFRKIGRQFGIVDKYALVRTVHRKGIERGAEWHPKQPVMNRTSVREASMDYEPADKDVDLLDED
ncbi:MAG: hypothetical protein GY716_17335 [bacterium]|nr:hypothetical protein [bacterium]